MRDVTELLEAAGPSAPGEPPLLAFVQQLRDARVHLDLTPSGIEDSIASASLSVPEHGGAIRTILGAGRAHAVGVYASAKSGRLQPYDGLVERGLVHWCEADGHTVDYQTQPAVLRYRTPTGWAAWVIDLWRQMDDGTREAIEVKRTPRDLMKPGYAAKLACGAAVITSLGYRFRLMYRDEIRGTVHRRRNVARIQARRNVVLPEGAFDRIERLAVEGTANLGMVRRAIHSDARIGMAGVHRLLASGRILADLDGYLCDATPVRIASPHTVESRIRFG